MEKKVLKRDQKIDYFSIALGVAGIRFDEPMIVELMVDLYETMLDKQGKVSLDEIIELKNAYVKKTQENAEPNGKGNSPEKTGAGSKDN